MNYMNKHEFFYKMDYEYLYYIMYVYTGNVKTSSSVCKSETLMSLQITNSA